MRKQIACGTFLVVTSVIIGSEKDHLTLNPKFHAKVVATYDSSNKDIRIGNREINNSVLLALKQKDKELLEGIARPSFLAACCVGINNHRIRESDIEVILKIANSEKGKDLRETIAGMEVETINTENSCCLNNKTNDCFVSKLMCSQLTGCSSGMPFAIGGICMPDKCCCYAAAPVGIFSALLTCLGLECVTCMRHHYCSERKTYRFDLDKNEVSQENVIN